MTDTEITALAREYAEETCKDIPRNNDIKSLRKSAIKLSAEGMETRLRWLLRRYCLVEKSKATDLCRLTLEHGDSEDYGLIDGLTDIVCEIFSEQYHQVADKPEIAKEVQP